MDNCSNYKNCNNCNQYDYSFKIILIGDYAVGKTNIKLQYCDNKYNPCATTTIGIDFETINKIINKKKVKISLWDTANQERYQKISLPYYKGASAIIIVYDVTNIVSFENAIANIKTVRDHTESVEIILFWNKNDSTHKIVKMEDGKYFANKNNVHFFEGSAKNNQQIQEMFEFIINNLITKNELSIVNNELSC